MVIQTRAAGGVIAEAEGARLAFLLVVVIIAVVVIGIGVVAAI